MDDQGHAAPGSSCQIDQRLAFDDRSRDLLPARLLEEALVAGDAADASSASSRLARACIIRSRVAAPSSPVAPALSWDSRLCNSCTAWL